MSSTVWPPMHSIAQKARHRAGRVGAFGLSDSLDVVMRD
jgi:hypothetical protein